MDPVTGVLMDRKCECTENAPAKCVCISSSEDESKGPSTPSTDKSTVLGMADPRYFLLKAFN